MLTGKILVVEDEKDILELITYNLTKNGFEVNGVTSGEQALKIARSNWPDLVVLDLMLPGVEGLDVCRLMKGDAKTKNIPIVIVTAKAEEADIVTGLELGADDYITKPFSPRVLVARVKAVLRRNEAQDEESGDKAIAVHGITIHPGRYEVLVNNSPVELTLTEFRILHFLACHPGWVYTRNQILDAAKGEDYIVTDRSVDVQIASLRKKLGSASKYIETVRGIGYRLKEC
ncbi:response regulator [Candidatus Uabimicrobium amorphum]|uniref:DNA-binding response regulator n=1 Tax=Uabimicrobium amorphum TaxID=2596890 RepID=A0A5S9ILQ7_UABAM|nr:response regulator transcription factor [Candidatus Uabimicrobium amorphum]BBM83756.1 DNA-binding response regulator [Candidatus Uabimicrobium amorphum]